MKRVMAWMAALLVLLLCGFAAAETENTGHDVIFIVTRGPRMDRDDPNQTRFEWMTALAVQYAAPNNRYIVVPCPLAGEELEWKELQTYDDAMGLKETLVQLRQEDYSDAALVTSQSLKAACAKASESDRPTTVMLVHTGTIDVKDSQYEDETRLWLDSLGDRLIVLDTRKPEDQDGNSIPVVGGLSQESGSTYILPLDESSRKRLLMSGLSVYEVESAFTAMQGGGTFTLEADGAAVLTLLLPGSANPETLELKTPDGAIIKCGHDRPFELDGMLYWRIPLSEHRTRGVWTLTFGEEAPEDLAFSNVQVLCSWGTLTGRAAEMSESEFGRETELALTLEELSGGDAPDMEQWLRQNAVATAEIYAAPEEAGAAGQRVQSLALTMDEDGWHGSVKLGVGRYDVRYMLTNSAGESLLSGDAVQRVSVINREPQTTEKAQALSDQSLVYNVPGEKSSLSWTFEELFYDTPEDRLTYAYDIKPADYEIREQTDESGALIGLTLAAPKGKALEPAALTLTATDGAGAVCKLTLNIEPVDAMELLGQIKLDARLSGTPKKNAPFSIKATMETPDLLPSSIKQALNVEVKLWDNDPWREMTKTAEGVWCYDEKAPSTACDYDINLRVRLRIDDAELETMVSDEDKFSDDGHYEAATYSVGKFHVSNSAPTATQPETTFDLNVEPFLKPNDFFKTEGINLAAWFADADGDALTITMATEKGKLVQEGDVIRVEKSESGSKLAVDVGEHVMLAVCRGGEYHIAVSASDSEGAASKPVAIVIRAHSQTKKAVILIIIAASALMLSAVVVALWQLSKPRFSAKCALTMTLKASGALGEIESEPIKLKNLGRKAVPLLQLYALGGIPRVKSLSDKVLRNITVRPRKGGGILVKGNFDKEQIAKGYDIIEQKEGGKWILRKGEKELLIMDCSTKNGQ